MNYLELRRSLQETEGLERLKALYGSRNGVLVSQMARYQALLKRHEDRYAAKGDILLASAPGRTEIIGNHTDHNMGRVLAAAINLDTLAAVSPREDLIVRIASEGYAPFELDLSDLAPQAAEQGTSAALVRGIAQRMTQLNMRIGGFDAEVTSQVRSGSGLSSSAAFEVLICCILDQLYNDGHMDPVLRAKISQYAENHHFGKPSGLMDQMASSLGGMTGIDFRQEEPEIEHLDYDFQAEGYAIVVVATGGSHDDLTQEYAAIKQEMTQVAGFFGQNVLRRVRPEQVLMHLKELRQLYGDRAVLRSLHFFQENERVAKALAALQAGDSAAFLKQINLSGQSSWEKLQNVAVSASHQPLCIALALAEELLQGEGACRLHGGGFAGTTLNFVPNAQVEAFIKGMEAVFGEKSCYILGVRPQGAAKVF